MPAGAILVNVARGEVVDQRALVDAVDHGRLRGAFLDVLEAEPPAADDRVLHHPRIVVTPHAGFYSDVTVRDYALVAVENAIAALAQQALPS
jgi:D-3-phosphoglycerate dehydrogenase